MIRKNGDIEKNEREREREKKKKEKKERELLLHHLVFDLWKLRT